MSIQLDKINPKFRQLTDLLFFSDRMDLDLTEYKSFLKEKYDIHYEYLWDRFDKSTNICWENGNQFWAQRLSFLLNIGDKGLIVQVEDHLEKKMFGLLRSKYEVNDQFDIEYIQFLELCKIKHYNKDSLLLIKSQLLDMPSHINIDKLISIINSFIPFVFSSMDEYAENIVKRITVSSRHFDLLVALERHGIAFDKEPIISLAYEIIAERTFSEKKRRALFTIINDAGIRAELKKKYTPANRDRFLQFLESCDYQMIEEHHLRNIKNIIDLDPCIADDLSAIYADKLYSRTTGHKRANADRLIRLLKAVPQITPKKILVWLSANNKVPDIKYMLTAFPDLKKLAAFV